MATADISRVLEQVGAGDRYRLIGGLTVMLHVQSLGLDLPIRATGDADFGLSPVALREPTLVDAIEQLGYRRVAGNRWERPVDERRIATVDLLAPSYTARARHDIRFGDVVTSEILGLAEAFLRPSVSLDARTRQRLAIELIAGRALPAITDRLRPSDADQDPGPTPRCGRYLDLNGDLGILLARHMPARGPLRFARTTDGQTDLGVRATLAAPPVGYPTEHVQTGRAQLCRSGASGARLATAHTGLI